MTDRRAGWLFLVILLVLAVSCAFVVWDTWRESTPPRRPVPTPTVSVSPCPEHGCCAPQCTMVGG